MKQKEGSESLGRTAFRVLDTGELSRLAGVPRLRRINSVLKLALQRSE